ncbi:c-type cytochrome biogenesis protein CcmI [Ancylobacter terrae]|uniref:c-type cytochrome biogenesis protein CcmI n=1 Tax=Ancylobacter sp. sgz301288 TaxID=3342077 RepID=UPI00385C5584
MLLWTAFVLMTAAAVLAVLWPLQARPAGGADDNAADLAVYRDQLAEVERDRLSGRIGGGEAEAARTEVARRMIAAADRTERPRATADTLRRRAVAVLAIAGLPVLAGAVYLHLGSPGLEGQPLAARLSSAPEQADLAVLLRRVEAHLEANPDDARGHEVVAPIYYRIGRLDESIRAWQNAIRLDGPSEARETGLGEALTANAGGVVTAEAKTAFEQALALDAKAVKARYYLGLAAEQDGRRDDAARFWGGLVADAPADAPWLPMVRSALARVTQPGPSAEEVANAAQMSPEARTAMVRGMVDRLAERLAQDGNDIEGWLRLVRAWSVLGDNDKARAAAGKARGQFAADPGALARIEALARELGLEG